MNVRLDDLGDAAGQKVPNDDAAVVAPHRQQRPETVEGQGQGHGDAVQRTLVLLGVILAKRF